MSLPVAGGIHKGVPAQDLPPGFTPEAQNFVADVDGFIRPRSGVSSIYTTNTTNPVLGAAEVFDVGGESVGFAPSATSLYVVHPTNLTWSELSYVPGTVASAMTDGLVSGTSTDYFRTTSIYDIDTEAFIAVTSNNTNAIKFFEVDAATTTYSDFTFVDSLDSTKKAKGVTSVNDRLVFFNTESSAGTRFPTRVYWSERGRPKGFDIASGAGFEDIMDMKGSGQAAVRFKDFLLLFTEYEVWRATPTLDNYAFRFDRVVDSVGCPWPRTITALPEGVVFVGRDREVYITDGAGVFPLGPIGAQGPSRIQRILEASPLLERAFGVFNQTEYRYELYFPTTASTRGFADAALFYDLRGASWWKQDLGFDATSGVDMDDVGDLVTYDEVLDVYDDVSLDFDSYGVASGARSVHVFSSDGTIGVFGSDHTTDLGAAIDARWRSGGIRAPDHRKMHLTEVWTDFEAASDSSMTLHVGAARDDAAFDTGTALSLTTASEAAPLFTPVWKTGAAPNIEVRLDDGGRPRISSFHLTLKDGSRF